MTLVDPVALKILKTFDIDDFYRISFSPVHLRAVLRTREGDVFLLDLDAEEKAGKLPAFDKGAAKTALAGAAAQASGCGSSAQLEGTRVSVTFAPSGRVTQALVTSGPAAGTAAGGCIARAFRSARIKPYSGERVTLLKTVYPRQAR